MKCSSEKGEVSLSKTVHQQGLVSLKCVCVCEHSHRRIHGGVSSQLLRVIEPFFAFRQDGIAATPEASFLADTKVGLSGCLSTREEGVGMYL